MHDIDHKKIKRILITRLRFMGDVILTTPLIRHVRREFPHAYLAYMTAEPFAPLLAHNPYLDEVIPFRRQASPQAGGWAQWRGQLDFIRQLRSKRFDLVIDLFGNPRTALLSWLSGASWRVGGDFRGRGRLYNLRVPSPDHPVDAIQFHLRSLERLGLSLPTDRKTEVFVTNDELAAAAEYLHRLGLDPGSPLVALHPGASWPNKHWPLPAFSQLAQALVADDLQVLVTSGPGETHLAAELARIPGVVAGDVLPLRTLAAVLAHVSLYIANDCGVMHLTAAVGTPTFGIFGPGEPEIWFPYRPENGHRAFWADIECRPCHQNECPLGTLACMHATTPQQVLDAVRSQLAARVKAS